MLIRPFTDCFCSSRSRSSCPFGTVCRSVARSCSVDHLSNTICRMPLAPVRLLLMFTANARMRMGSTTCAAAGSTVASISPNAITNEAGRRRIRVMVVSTFPVEEFLMRPRCMTHTRAGTADRLRFGRISPVIMPRSSRSERPATKYWRGSTICTWPTSSRPT